MSICTCRYCLCFFNVVAMVNTCMLCWIIVTYVIFGNMPPSFTMAIGFWLLVYTNYFGIYVSLLAEAAFYRNEDVWWINRLTQGGIIACVFLFLIGSVLFFIPLSAEAMMQFSRTYYKLYGEIPPFLDNMQAKFKCCGIYNYLDYGRKDWTNYGYGENGFTVYRHATSNDDFFHELITDLTQNRTVVRKTTGLDVPQSCCITEKALNPLETECGTKVEYTNSPNEKLILKQQESAAAKINDPGMGCFEKYENIRKTGFQFQLTYLIGMVQWMSFFQSLLFLALLWFHRLALKTIRQLNYWLPELLDLHEDLEMARAHANLEAEADEAHGRGEVKIKKSKSRGKSLLVHNPQRHSISPRHTKSLHKTSGSSHSSHGRKKPSGENRASADTASRVSV